jgi:hypothetical protein
MTEQQLAAMRQALEALEHGLDYAKGEQFENAQRFKGYEHLAPDDAHSVKLIEEAITTLRTAIEQAETAQGQEPLGYWNAVQGWVDLPEETHKPAAWVYPEFWEHLERGNCGTAYRLPGEGRQPLYTRPQPAEWVGLTDEEFEVVLPYCHNEFDLQEYKDFARAIEAKLKEKNIK